jgi:hypothetical protein
MRKVLLVSVMTAGAALLALFAARLAPSSSNASSHREAPLIPDDPTADNTDLHAFRSPDKPSTSHFPYVPAPHDGYANSKATHTT